MKTMKNSEIAIKIWLSKITDQKITKVWHNGNNYYVAEIQDSKDWISVTAEPLDEQEEKIKIMEVRYMEEA